LSSILKALKKLEDEYPNGEDQISWPQRTGTTRIIRRWEIHSGRFTRILWGFIGLIILAAAGWFVFYMQRPIAADAVPAETIPEPVAVRTSSAGEFLSPAQPPADPEPSHSPAARPAERTPEPKRIPAAGPWSPSTVKPVTPAQGLPDEPPGAASPPVDTGRSALPKPAGLRLQAISWSRQPSERIAVIDNEIVREGAALKGYSVIRIESDKVVLRKDGEEWALAFKLQKSSD
jgi:hypothetical protein